MPDIENRPDIETCRWGTVPDIEKDIEKRRKRGEDRALPGTAFGVTARA